jgi:hypothetical protein
MLELTRDTYMATSFASTANMIFTADQRLRLGPGRLRLRQQCDYHFNAMSVDYTQTAKYIYFIFNILNILIMKYGSASLNIFSSLSAASTTSTASLTSTMARGLDCCIDYVGHDFRALAPSTPSASSTCFGMQLVLRVDYVRHGADSTVVAQTRPAHRLRPS